jgi:RecA/RadA recombinase
MKKKMISSTEVNYDNLLNEIQGLIQKDYASVSRQKFTQLDYCPTGNAAMDFILTNQLSCGGWPMSKIIELYGNNQTGKSLLGSLALISAQKGRIFIREENAYMPGVGLLIDTEQSFNGDFFAQLGGDPERLFVVQRNTTGGKKKVVGKTDDEDADEADDKKKDDGKKKRGSVDEPLSVESCYEIMEKFIERVRSKSKNVPIVIVWDSLASTPTQHELDEGARAIDYGKRAQRHGVGMRTIQGVLAQNNVLLIIVNQLRHTMAMFGPDKESVGGEAVKYAASLRVHLKKGKRIFQKLDGKTVLGNFGTRMDPKLLAGIQGVMQIEKTRFTIPFRGITFDLFFRGGLSPFSGFYEAITDWHRDLGGLILPMQKVEKETEEKEPEEKTEGKEKKAKTSRNWLYQPKDAAEPIKFSKKTFAKLLEDREELRGVYNLEEGSSLPGEDEIEVSEEEDNSEENPYATKSDSKRAGSKDAFAEDDE